MNKSAVAQGKKHENRRESGGFHVFPCHFGTKSRTISHFRQSFFVFSQKISQNH
jgi:hypothetical protein